MASASAAADVRDAEKCETKVMIDGSCDASLKPDAVNMLPGEAW